MPVRSEGILAAPRVLERRRHAQTISSKYIRDEDISLPRDPGLNF